MRINLLGLGVALLSAGFGSACSDTQGPGDSGMLGGGTTSSAGNVNATGGVAPLGQAGSSSAAGGSAMGGNSMGGNSMGGGAVAGQSGAGTAGQGTAGGGLAGAGPVDYDLDCGAA